MKKLTTPDLLNPPPPSFSRLPPPNLPYPPFPQCVVIGKGNSLTKGFPILPPQTDVQPHPFVTHDVNEDDWARFLGDVKKASKLSIMEHVVTGAVPAVLGITIVGGAHLDIHIILDLSHAGWLSSGSYPSFSRNRVRYEAQEEESSCAAHRTLEPRVYIQFPI